MIKYEFTCHDDADPEMVKAFIGIIMGMTENFEGEGIGTEHIGLHIEFFGPESSKDPKLEEIEIPRAVRNDFAYIFCTMYEYGGMGGYSEEFFFDRGGSVVNSSNGEVLDAGPTNQQKG